MGLLNKKTAKTESAPAGKISLDDEAMDHVVGGIMDPYTVAETMCRDMLDQSVANIKDAFRAPFTNNKTDR